MNAIIRYLALIFSAVGSGMIFILWQSILLKGLLLFATLFPYKPNKKYLVIYLLSFILLLIHAYVHSATDLYQLRAVFFICGISVAIGLLSAAKKITDHGIRSFKVLFFSMVLIVFIGNLVALLSGETTLVNNLFADETDRFRGVFPELILFALILCIKSRLWAILYILLGTLIFFLLTGGRGFSVMFAITTLLALHLNSKNFWWYLMIQNVFLYPSFLFLSGLFLDLSGSFLVKSSGILTVFDSLGYLGNGMQPPVGLITEDRISELGHHFSAADYGFVGLVYELGLLFAALRIFLFYIVLKKIASLGNSPQVKLLLYVIAPFILSYGIAIDFMTGILNVLLFLVIVIDRHSSGFLSGKY